MSPEVRGIIELVSRIHGVPGTLILSKERNRSTVRAREHALALVRWSTDKSYPDIGREFGMDHTSVIAAVERYEAKLNGEAELLNARTKAKWAAHQARLESEGAPL